MIDVYKRLKLYMNYVKFLVGNPNSTFDDYVNYLMDNKEMSSDFNGEEQYYRIFYVGFAQPYKCALMNISSVFKKPEGMKQEDFLKIISFIRHYMLINLSAIGDFEFILKNKFGFDIMWDESKCDSIIDLYITDKSYDFINSSFYEKYFSWYTSSTITIEEIVKIYEEIGLSKKLKIINNKHA